MAVVVYFDGYVRDPALPVGFDVATDEFMAAFIRYAGQETLPCITPNDFDFGTFKQKVEALGGDPRRCRRIQAGDGEAIGAAGALFHYTPDIIADVWRRRHGGQRRYSLIGLAHTSSTDTIMDIAGAYLTAPTQSWDALICPSAAIRSVYDHAIQSWRAYLGERLGADAADCPMRFPVIPLGVDCGRFSDTDGALRAAQRGHLGLAAEDIAILFVGRLSHYAKANQLPLLIAGEDVARRTGKSLHLIFVGYFPDDDTEAAFRATAAEICKTCRVHIVATDDAAIPRGFWAGADIFCSLSDNIQESFGLTPVEAMAAGLPAVVSDWDGYRDTVRDGIDGIAIPTLLPGAGAGGDLAYRYFTGIDSYGEYLAAAAQATAVDHDALARALTELAENPDARRAMGEAGRRRARDSFDWRHVIAAYENLFAELAAGREKDPESMPYSADTGESFHPLRPDPFAAFAGFASAAMTGSGTIELVIRDWESAAARMTTPLSVFNAGALIDRDDLAPVIGHLESAGAMTLDDLCRALPELDQRALLRTLAWLVKLGVCRYTGAP